MTAFRLRIAGVLDLPAINAVVEQAVSSWDAAERVKRLALPVYFYRREDSDHMWLLVGEDRDGSVIAVVALEDGAIKDVPAARRALLLHGIFVSPDRMGLGIGTQLVEASAGIARSLSYDGLLVKAVRQSKGFFERCGLEALTQTAADEYPYRFWLPVDSPCAGCAEDSQPLHHAI